MLENVVEKKEVKKDTKNGTVTVKVTLKPCLRRSRTSLGVQTPVRCKTRHVQRWLTEEGVDFGEVVESCTISNDVSGKEKGYIPEGKWVFKLNKAQKTRYTKKKLHPKIEEIK